MKKDIKNMFADSVYNMADITKKTPSFRRAVAMGVIDVGAVGFEHISQGILPKGDVLKLAEIAGINGAKQAWQQIPLCHPLQLDHVSVCTELQEDSNSVVVYAVVATTAKTGVEMEALAAVNAALLTIYDLTKPVEPALNISEIRLLLKEGGKKGLWVHPDGVPECLQDYLPVQSQRLLDGVRVGVITLSDRASSGEYVDKSGAALQNIVTNLGGEVIVYSVLADDERKLEKEIISLVGNVELIITTGGTGLAPRDVTPETISRIANYEIPGIGEVLRSSGALHVPTAWLSRSLGAVIDDTLIISLPGSVNAVGEGMDAIKGILKHALQHVQGEKNIHDTFVVGDVA